MRDEMQVPLILVTNDDGIDSTGLRALVVAMSGLGEVMVVAPARQWSGAGRSMPPGVTGQITPAANGVEKLCAAAYAVDASPALSVVHAITELLPRMPDLVVSGINYGLNISTDVTISGTVGAALEAAAFGVPALAVSLEMDPQYHLVGDVAADYEAAQAFARQFARQLLSYPLPRDVAALNLNVPADARLSTPWRRTRLSTRRHFAPSAPKREEGRGRPGYSAQPFYSAEEDSDVRAVCQDRVVSVTPLSLDLTARVGGADPWRPANMPVVRNIYQEERVF
jgi:5'-nucleotidase